LNDLKEINLEKNLEKFIFGILFAFIKKGGQKDRLFKLKITPKVMS